MPPQVQERSRSPFLAPKLARILLENLRMRDGEGFRLSKIFENATIVGHFQGKKYRQLSYEISSEA